MTARITGAGLLVLGAATAAFPALVWFSAPPVGDPTQATGFGGSGWLWPLPVLGALIVLAGIGLVAARPEGVRAAARWTGPLAALAGLVALTLAIAAGAYPDLTLRITTDAGTQVISAPVTLTTAAVTAPIVAGLAGLVGAGAAWVGWRGR